MNVFEFAVNFEKENREYYLERSEKTDSPYLKNLFQQLADEEKKHEEIVIQLMNEGTVEDVESDIIDTAKNTFRSMAQDLPDTVLPTEEVHIYKQAIELERKSKEYYQDKAERAELSEVKKVFQQLAREEARHQNIMENITELVNRPNTWLEDAEWNHLDQY